MPDQSYPLRSMLFTPGNHARRVEKALALNADAVILDLEDAVASAEKPAARTAVAEIVARPREGGPRLYVRINASDTQWYEEDLQTIVGQGVDGIVLPKAERPEDITATENIIADMEAAKNLQPGAIDLLPIVETGVGLTSVRAIAAAGTRVNCLSFGAADFVVDMNMRWTPGETELTPQRAEIALASRAAGLSAPIDSVWTWLKDGDGLAASANRVRDMGYQGKLCIHPDQIAPIHTAFTPSDEEIVFADKVISAFATAEAKGTASISVDGHFVDYPVVERARRLHDFMTTIRNRKAAP